VIELGCRYYVGTTFSRIHDFSGRHFAFLDTGKPLEKSFTSSSSGVKLKDYACYCHLLV